MKSLEQHIASMEQRCKEIEAEIASIDRDIAFLQSKPTLVKPSKLENVLVFGVFVLSVVFGVLALVSAIL